MKFRIRFDDGLKSLCGYHSSQTRSLLIGGNYVVIVQTYAKLRLVYEHKPFCVSAYQSTHDKAGGIPQPVIEFQIDGGRII